MLPIFSVQASQIRYTYDENLRIYLNYSSLSRPAFTGSCSAQYISVSEAAAIAAPNTQHQFIELKK